MTITKKYSKIIVLAGLAAVLASCSGPQVRDVPPEVRLAEAREDVSKKHYEEAQEALEELKLVTAGTSLGGEVQYLLAETKYLRGDMAEAEMAYETYLLSYPGGSFTEDALFGQAISKVRQIEKVRLGFFSFRKYIPHERDVSVIREARGLFERYLQAYPEGQRAEEARQRVDVLLTREGEHELDIASFYLRKDEPGAALGRARRILEGPFPEPILERARKLADKAESALKANPEGSGP